MNRPPSSAASSVASNATLDAFVADLDIARIRELALTIRHAQLRRPQLQHIEGVQCPDEISCDVVTPPTSGGFNVVYEVNFIDGVSWVIRLPFDRWDSIKACSMHHDVVTMEYIMSRTSLPIPRLHDYSIDEENALRHPYMVMDKVRGTRLSEVWQDNSWWMGERSKEALFDSLAGYMTELATLEFDKIGRLDRAEPEGTYCIVPHPSGTRHIAIEDGPHEAFGPFESTHAYLTALVAESHRRHGIRADSYAILQMFVGALPDARFDGPPFMLGYPDYNPQNIFVDDAGRVVGFIDWDEVCVSPRQLGALAYPPWLTLDWCPIIYAGYKELPEYDSEGDLHMYRTMYTEAIRRASGGRFDDITRNSHLVVSLHTAAGNLMYMFSIMLKLGQYVFGSENLTFDVQEAMNHSGWLTGAPGEVARVKLWEKADKFAEGGSHHSGDDADAPADENNQDDAVSQTGHQRDDQTHLVTRGAQLNA